MARIKICEESRHVRGFYPAKCLKSLVYARFWAFFVRRGVFVEKQLEKFENNRDIFDETVGERYNIYNILKEDTLWDWHIS